MTDNQREKISPDQEKQRKEINWIIKKATGRGISELIKETWPNNKSKYYSNVIKIPLTPEFVDLIKNTFSVDLSDFLRQNKQGAEANTLTREYLLAENNRLHKKLEEILEKKLEKTEEINDLYRENRKLEKENQELKSKIK